MGTSLVPGAVKCEDAKDTPFEAAHPASLALATNGQCDGGVLHYPRNVPFGICGGILLTFALIGWDDLGGSMGAATATARGYFGRLAGRYKNAYGISAATIKLGNLVKETAIVLAVAVTLGGVVVSVPSDPIQQAPVNWFHLLCALFVGVVILAAGAISGAFLAAQGQLMSALLDTAVNTSPHLQDLEKASVLTL
jgi:hypothetical protein